MKEVWPGLSIPCTPSFAPALTGSSLEPAPCPSGLALREDRAQLGVTLGRERPGCSPLHTRCAVTHTPKPSQLDLRFCKTRCQPNVKHIDSQKQLGGRRAAQHPATLGRASERGSAEGRGQPVRAYPLKSLFP